MQVEVDKRRALPAVVRQEIRRVDRQQSRADPAARAHEGDDAAELGRRLAGLAGNAFRQRCVQEKGVQRLD